MAYPNIVARITKPDPRSRCRGHRMILADLYDNSAFGEVLLGLSEFFRDEFSAMILLRLGRLIGFFSCNSELISFSGESLVGI